jgi:hypothetical protein
VDVGIADEEVARGLLGLVKLARVDEVDDAVRRLVEPVVVPEPPSRFAGR